MNNAVMFSSATDQWATPQEFFDKLDAEFEFNLDPCADATNHKCAEYFTREDDGLKQNWGGVKEYSAILRMAERSANGCKSALKK